MTHITAPQAHVGFIRTLILPALLLWPVLAATRHPDLSDTHHLLGLLALAGLLRTLERRPAAGAALVAATFVMLRATAPTPQADALFSVLIPYVTALALSLALLHRR